MKTIDSWMVPLGGAALLLGLFVYHDLVVYQNYLLRGDEPAFINATLESPSSWFSRGYLNYFDIYPEWGTPYPTPFLKPVSNAVSYLNYTLFGSNYAFHFATFFLTQFLGLLVFVRLPGDLNVPPLATTGAALLFLVNPAFMNAGLTCLSCHFDVLAGVFALAAFLAVWRRWYGAAFLALTLAVFTKESAVFAPLAAALSIVIWRRPTIISILMVLPLALWAAARFLAYGDVLNTGVATPFAGISTRGALIWPTGLVTFEFVRDLGLSLPSGRAEILSAVFLIANIGLWGFLGYAAFVTAREHIDAPERAALTTALLVWTLGALSFGVLVGYHARYGGSIYPFLYLLLTSLVFSPNYRVPRLVAVCILLVFSVATVVQGGRRVRLALDWPSVIAPERALHDALRALPQDKRTVYVVNAPPGLASAPQHLSGAWSLNLDIVIVNKFAGCTTSSDAGSGQFLDSAARLISLRIPACATFEIGKVTPDLSAVGSGLSFNRNGVGTYVFPSGIAGPSDEGRALGQELRFQIDPKRPAVTLVGYSWNSADYHVIGQP